MSVAVAYSEGHIPAYLVYGGVVVLAAAVVGGIWQAPGAVPGELSGFWVGFVFLGGWALGSVVVGGLGLVGWRSVQRTRGGPW
ncbi:MAG: hypothetical protein O6913_05770 [Chloroflexi bacterium]|nr:hypothetical protein [Chloroflexota bacterium]